MKKRRIGYAIMVFALILCFVFDAALAGTLPTFNFQFGDVVAGGRPSNSQTESNSTNNSGTTDSETESDSEAEPEVKPEDLEPVQEETKKVINDMSKAFSILLQRGTKTEPSLAGKGTSLRGSRPKEMQPFISAR